MSDKPSIWGLIFIPVSFLTILIMVMLKEYAIIKTVSIIAFIQSCGLLYRFYQTKKDENSPDL